MARQITSGAQQYSHYAAISAYLTEGRLGKEEQKQCFGKNHKVSHQFLKIT